MSALEFEAVSCPLIRTFDSEMSVAGDGRTVDLRIVPYNVPARVADPPDFKPYEEVWMPGAFEKQLRAANRIDAWLNIEHEEGIRGIIGHGVSLDDQPDALYGSFRIHTTSDGDKALHLLNEGLLTGVSIEFVPQRSAVVGGRVQRVKARMTGAALCRPITPHGAPAYNEAAVLAVRTTPHMAEMPPPLDQDVFEKLVRLGIEKDPETTE